MIDYRRVVWADLMMSEMDADCLRLAVDRTPPKRDIEPRLNTRHDPMGRELLDSFERELGEQSEVNP